MTSAFFTTPLTLRFGTKTLTLVPQAKVVFIAFIVMAISMIGHVLVGLRPLSLPIAAWLIIGLLYIIFYALMLALSTYVVNCTVVGNCTVYAWIVAGYISVAAVFSTLFTIMSLVSPKK
jgi:MFS family permease